MNISIDFNEIIKLGQSAPKEAVSVHFGPKSMRLAAFRRHGNNWRMENLAEQVLSSPPDAKAVEKGIAEFLTKNGFLKSVALVAAWDTGFLEKTVVLPEMPDSEIRAALTFGMEQNFQLKIEECLIGWLASIDIAPVQGTKARQYFIYVTRQDDASAYTAPLKQVSENISAYIPGSIAFTWGLKSVLYNTVADILCLDIGLKSSNLMILRQGKPLLARHIDVGEEIFYESLKDLIRNAGESGMPQLSYKDIVGKISLDPSVPSELESDFHDVVVENLKPMIEKLLEAVEATIIYYRQQSYAGQLGEIYLYGEALNIRGLDVYLQNALELPVKRPEYQKFPALAIEPEVEGLFRKDFTNYLGVVGAFLCWKEKGLNLVPQSLLINSLLRSQKKIFVYITILLAVLSTLLVGGNAISMMTRQMRLNDTAQRINQSKRVVNVFNDIAALRSFKAGQESGELALVSFMKFLAQATPRSVVLQSLSYEKGTKKIEIAGKVYQNTQDPVGVCAEFVDNLTASPFFETTDLTEGVRSPAGDEYQFKIKGVLNAG